MRPVIGLSTGSVNLDGPFGVLPTQALAHTYTTAVRVAGGIPVVIPTEDGEVEEPILERLGGLILTGGGDVEPTLHGRPHHASVRGVDPTRDRCELLLATTAREQRLPVLGICRGLQVLNVALGGDLIIDISSEVIDAVNHRTGEPGAMATHPVRVAPGSRLACLVGDQVVVNSSHHQASGRLGDGLHAVAWAADGVIEAVEADDERWWCCGVQWHPEQRPPDNLAARKPFAALVEAAGEHHRLQQRQPSSRQPCSRT
jgi:putative glutamine amidotransferase